MMYRSTVENRTRKLGKTFGLVYLTGVNTANTLQCGLKQSVQYHLQEGA